MKLHFDLHLVLMVQHYSQIGLKVELHLLLGLKVTLYLTSSHRLRIKNSLFSELWRKQSLIPRIKIKICIDFRIILQVQFTYTWMWNWNSTFTSSHKWKVTYPFKLYWPTGVRAKVQLSLCLRMKIYTHNVFKQNFRYSLFWELNSTYTLL